MGVFAELVALKKNAEDCQGTAQVAIQHIGMSMATIWDESWPHDEAARLLRDVDNACRNLQSAIEARQAIDRDGNALDTIRRVVGLRRDPIRVGNRTYATAHEATEATARITLEAMRIGRLKYDSPMAMMEAIASRLRALDMPDLAGQLEQEYQAAAELLPPDDEPVVKGATAPVDKATRECDAWLVDQWERGSSLQVILNRFNQPSRQKWGPPSGESGLRKRLDAAYQRVKNTSYPRRPQGRRPGK